MQRTATLAKVALILILSPILQAASGDPIFVNAAEREARAERPIHIEILADLNFSRAAVTNSSNAEMAIGADNASRKSSSGLVDLGGFAMAGQVRVSGEPGRAVRVELPHLVKMHSGSGSSIEISDLRSNLPPAPRLDAQGELNFNFGGRLTLKGTASGAFRGRIPITVEYQ